MLYSGVYPGYIGVYSGYIRGLYGVYTGSIGVYTGSIRGLYGVLESAYIAPRHPGWLAGRSLIGLGGDPGNPKRQGWGQAHALGPGPREPEEPEK